MQINDEQIIAYVAGALRGEEAQQIESELSTNAELRARLDRVKKAWPTQAQIAKAKAIEARKEAAWDAIARQTTRKTIRFDLRTVMMRVAAVAVVLMALGVALLNMVTSPDVTYTAQNERMEVTLPDQSTVILSPHSTLNFTQTRQGLRKAELEGVAHFSVAHDTKHPFEVHADETKVVVLGTKFTVENIAERGRVHVNVEEGKVRFDAGESTEELTAQQFATLQDDKMTTGTHSTSNIDWTTQTLTFRGATLGSVIEKLYELYPEIKGIRGECNDDSTLLSTTFAHQPLDEVIDELNIHFDEKITLDNGFLAISD